MDAGRQALTSAKLLLTSPSAMRTSFVGMTPVKERERLVLLSAQVSSDRCTHHSEIPNRLEAWEYKFLVLYVRRLKERKDHSQGYLQMFFKGGKNSRHKLTREAPRCSPHSHRSSHDLRLLWEKAATSKNHGGWCLCCPIQPLHPAQLDPELQHSRCFCRAPCSPITAFMRYVLLCLGEMQ